MAGMMVNTIIGVVEISKIDAIQGGFWLETELFDRFPESLISLIIRYFCLTLYSRYQWLRCP